MERKGERAMKAAYIQHGAVHVGGLADHGQGVQILALDDAARDQSIGLADQLEVLGIPCFGPSANAARLETSKAFTKDFCARHNLPTAAYGVFSDAVQADAFLAALPAPYVIKADGLAAGKGVVVAMTLAEALAAIDDMFSDRKSVV